MINDVNDTVCGLDVALDNFRIHIESNGWRNQGFFDLDATRLSIEGSVICNKGGVDFKKLQLKLRISDMRDHTSRVNTKVGGSGVIRQDVI